MPAVLIEVRRHATVDEEEAIIDAVRGSLIAEFRASADDLDIRLAVHEPHRFACPPNRTRPEFATLVTIDCFAGRSADVKRNAYREIVKRLESIGIPRDHVSVIVHDVPTESWGLPGGIAARDVVS
ncbi:tautomerase family protein [Sinomonas sp. ASV322]|uniref:tautomerase family protein n=1 Tax=Sinomonas sp. ASV322 TaxID=3041920 RepID=UPI0027DC6A06|nr:tautomerase family protein [Sinomonas sp. ASV322]MDQ4504239.1 tautomerase family protein [Sinomonas sp. ASV322]